MSECIHIYIYIDGYTYTYILTHTFHYVTSYPCVIYICRALCIQSSAPSRRNQLKPQKQIGCKTMESAWHCIYILCILRGYRAVRIAQTAHTVHTVGYNTHNTYTAYCIYCTYRTYPDVPTFWRSLIRNVLNTYWLSNVMEAYGSFIYSFAIGCYCFIHLLWHTYVYILFIHSLLVALAAHM